MATFFKGPLGGFSGSIGPLVGSSWKELEVMKSQPGPRKGTPTQAQLDQQAKFALAGGFITNVKKLLSLTMSDSSNMTSFNIVLQQILQDAITGTTNAWTIDYSKVQLSSGDLLNAFSYTVASAVAGKIAWTWQVDAGLQEDPTDKAILVAYSPDLGRAAYTTLGAARSAGADSLTIAAFSGKPVQTWLSFISADGKEIADSVFTGLVTVM
ncbi:MAG TPA: DUF6266 family protein [Chitinophagaceae bacterium]|jgi:hypothetical protein